MGYQNDIPQDATFATGEVSGNIIHFTGAVTAWEQPTSHPSDITSARQQLPKNAQWAIAQVTGPKDIRHVVEAIKRGTAVVVSDGSFKEGSGTSAFTLGSFTDYFLGVNQVPGVFSTHSAYRAELAGIVGGLTLLLLVCRVHNIRQGAVTLGLDGKNAMNRAEQDASHANMSDWDLIKAAHHLMNELPITCKWKWIQGHQDDDKEFSELDNWAKMNVVMDATAKQYWTHCATTKRQPFLQPLYGEQWSVHWNLRKLVNFKLPEIYAEHHGDITRDFWIDSGYFRKTNIHTPDWEAIHSPMKQLPFHRSI